MANDDESVAEPHTDNSPNINKSPPVSTPAESNTNTKESTTDRVDMKPSGNGDREEENRVSESCETLEKPLKPRYRPSWWGITIGLFIVISSLTALKGILFTLSYVFGATLILLALLPPSVSPAKIRCGNCGQLYKEKLGRCPHCNP